MHARILGIEFGETQIKLIEAIKQKECYSIQKFNAVDIPLDCVENGEITQSESIFKMIDEVLKTKKYKAKKVIVVVHSHKEINRKITIDKQPENAIRQILEVKPELFLPIQRKSYQIDFKVLSEQQNTLELQIVAVPSQLILSVVQMIKRLGRMLMCITVPSEAFVELLTNKVLIDEEMNQSAMILDIGYERTKIMIIMPSGGSLTRSIAFGMKHMQEATKDIVSELEKLNKNREDYFSIVIRPQMEYHILAEIERVLRFYYSDECIPPIQKGYLIGEGANMIGMREYLRDALNIPMEKISQLEKIRVAPGVAFEAHTNAFIYLLGAISGL